MEGDGKKAKKNRIRWSSGEWTVGARRVANIQYNTRLRGINHTEREEDEEDTSNYTTGRSVSAKEMGESGGGESRRRDPLAMAYAGTRLQGAFLDFVGGFLGFVRDDKQLLAGSRLRHKP